MMHVQVETRRGGRVVESRVIVVDARKRSGDDRQYLSGWTKIFTPLDPARPRQGSWCRQWSRPGTH